MTHGTAEYLSPGLGPIEGIRRFEAGDAVTLGDLRMDSFSVTHDAADPVSYVIRNGAANLGIATDLGNVNDLVRQRLAGCTALVLESNYCPDMLSASSYPESIRQRIRSTHGHLSNHDMNSLLAAVLHEALRLVVLVHISQENNTAELAQSLAAQVLRGHAAQLVVAAQDRPTPLFHLTDRVQSLQGVM
jgi:phosphoribosyl 1,2-cyclic phosphodiesterase